MTATKKTIHSSIIQFLSIPLLLNKALRISFIFDDFARLSADFWRPRLSLVRNDSKPSGDNHQFVGSVSERQVRKVLTRGLEMLKWSILGIRHGPVPH